MLVFLAGFLVCILFIGIALVIATTPYYREKSALLTVTLLFTAGAILFTFTQGLALTKNLTGAKDHMSSLYGCLF